MVFMTSFGTNQAGHIVYNDRVYVYHIWLRNGGKSIRVAPGTDELLTSPAVIGVHPGRKYRHSHGRAGFNLPSFAHRLHLNALLHSFCMLLRNSTTVE
jgi:hypothetical protein